MLISLDKNCAQGCLIFFHAKALQGVGIIINSLLVLTIIPECWVGCKGVQLQEGFNTGLEYQALDGIVSAVITGHVLLSVLIYGPGNIKYAKPL